MMEKLFNVDSGEWKTINISSASSYSQRPCSSAHRCMFKTVDVVIEVKRMPLFYMLYVILPLCGLILTFLLIFHLDIGQRASFGVGILLSISVYLMTISEHLPLKSDDTPVLGSVFTLHFFMMCLAVPLAEFTAHLAQRSHDSPPAWCTRVARLSLFRLCKKAYQKSCRSSEETTKCAKDFSSSDHDEKDFQHEWRKVGRFFDVFFSLVFLFVFVVSPMIIASLL